LFVGFAQVLAPLANSALLKALSEVRLIFLNRQYNKNKSIKKEHKMSNKNYQ